MFALAEALGVRRPMAVGLVELLIHFTAQYAPEGDIGRYSDKRIAAAMDWCGSPQKLIDALVATRWVDRHSVARLVVHDWLDHVDRSTLQRLSRLGKTAIQRNQDLTENLCTQSEPDTRTCQQQATNKPEPEPEPEPATSHTTAESPPDKSLAGLLAPSPLTARAIREAFPQTSDKFIRRLMTAVEKEIAGLAAPAPEPTDALIADAVRACRDPTQTSAGLFLTTVPRCLVTWATQGRVTRKPPTADRNQQRRENVNKVIKALQR